MERNIDANYLKFVKYLKAYVKRDGIENLIRYIESSDMRVAPASTKYHNSFDGGLVEHSLNVFNRLIKLIQMEYGNEIPYSKETIAIVGLLHDISKVNFYDKKLRNVKNDETGQWEQVPFYAVKDSKLVFGTHEENSLYILRRFFNLTYDEEIAIMYHMGTSVDSESQNRVYNAYNESTLAVLLHMADIASMTIDERVERESGDTISKFFESIEGEVSEENESVSE